MEGGFLARRLLDQPVDVGGAGNLAPGHLLDDIALLQPVMGGGAAIGDIDDHTPRMSSVRPSC
jgi:hypothetical protein